MTWLPSSELLYVQGLVAGSTGIVYPHAWCTDAEGHCIELTWDLANYNDSRYYGVTFTRRQLLHLQIEWGTYDWYEGFASVLLEAERDLKSGRRRAR